MKAEEYSEWQTTPQNPRVMKYKNKCKTFFFKEYFSQKSY